MRNKKGPPFFCVRVFNLYSLSSDSFSFTEKMPIVLTTRRTRMYRIRTDVIGWLKTRPARQFRLGYTETIYRAAASSDPSGGRSHSSAVKVRRHNRTTMGPCSQIIADSF